MSDPSIESPIFPGSGGAASVVEWLDRLLVDLRELGPAAVRDALEAGWRSGRDLSGIPPPVLEQTERALALAAAAVREGPSGADDAERAILLARSRFLPGA